MRVLVLDSGLSVLAQVIAFVKPAPLLSGDLHPCKFPCPAAGKGCTPLSQRLTPCLPSSLPRRPIHTARNYPNYPQTPTRLGAIGGS
eukprot:371200-Rhodomonas_salina.2